VPCFHVRPNPSFKPDSRETSILRAIEGTMCVDVAQQRVRRVEGVLKKGVSFGWGFAAHLDPGGLARIEQVEVAPNEWRMSHVEVNFRGSKALFVPLEIRLNNDYSEFTRVADHLRLEEGVDLLLSSATPIP
jgi:hypothetical protein